MSIRVCCPACSNRFAIFERLLGRSIRCPKCLKPMALPSVDDIKFQREVNKRNAAMARKLQEYSAQNDLLFPAIQPQPFSGAFLSSGVASKPKRERKPRDSEKDLEWDITPMVDVAFLLLIFFMLTASFSIQKVIRTAPQKNEQPSSNAIQQVSDDKDQTVTVHVDEQNTFAVVMPDGRTINAPSKQDLIVLLADARKQMGFGEPPKMIVLAHEESLHGSVVAALDAGREADFTRFEMLAVEEFP